MKARRCPLCGKIPVVNKVRLDKVRSDGRAEFDFEATIGCPECLEKTEPYWFTESAKAYPYRVRRRKGWVSVPDYFRERTEPFLWRLFIETMYLATVFVVTRRAIKSWNRGIDEYVRYKENSEWGT